MIKMNISVCIIVICNKIHLHTHKLEYLSPMLISQRVATKKQLFLQKKKKCLFYFFIYFILSTIVLFFENRIFLCIRVFSVEPF